MAIARPRRRAGERLRRCLEVTSGGTAGMLVSTLDYPTTRPYLSRG